MADLQNLRNTEQRLVRLSNSIQDGTASPALAVNAINSSIQTIKNFRENASTLPNREGL